MRRPQIALKQTLGAAFAAAGALSVVACSLELPDKVEDYKRGSKGQEGRPDAPASTVVGSPTLAPVDGGVLAIDGGVVDSGPPPPLACPPQPPPSFVPYPWIPPTAIHKNACTSQQASLLVDCLMTTVGATPACGNFFNSGQNGFCIQCGVTSVNAQRFGPILDDGVAHYTNPAGCIAALSGDSSATGCGSTYDALLQCEGASCDRCVSDQDYKACTDAADLGTCKPYASARACSAIYASACIGSSKVDEAIKLVKLWCMP